MLRIKKLIPTVQLCELKFVHSIESLSNIPAGKVRINTMYAYSFTVVQRDQIYAESIRSSDFLTPDGQSIVWAAKFLGMKDAPKERIAGWDLFCFEMERVRREAVGAGTPQKVMFMGSSEKVLALIRERAAKDYPELEIVTYSPPYKLEFSEEDNAAIIKEINEANPDLLWIGMTAPKQEKWVYAHWDELDIRCHCGAIGAVFDFYAGTVKRAPLWMQKAGMEWLHRLLSNPGRLWRRYIIGNAEFIRLILKEKL